MNRSDAEILWEVASVLARDAANVSRTRRHPLPPLMFFTDPVRTPRPWETAAQLPAGSGVVFRHFGRADAADTAQALRRVTRDRNLQLLIGLDADLAGTVGADGVHLPGRALDQAPALAATHPDWIITGAAHVREDLTAPGLDALVVSPVFPAGGASANRPSLGLATFAEWVRAAPCPVFALGGINSGNAGRLIGSGSCGIAGVAAIRSAFGPAIGPD